MEVRRFDRNDTQQLCDIYYNSIHHVNKADYTQEELEAWAPSGKNTAESLEKDTKRWQKIMPFVAVKEDVCLGFAELEDGGHIN